MSDALDGVAANAISEITRRDIFDALRLASVAWEGRLSETDFLSRIFDLTALPSHDHRCRDMLGDVSLHRQNFRDWDDGWIYDDGRLNLLRGPDEIFLRLLCEMVHPIVRNDDEVDDLVHLFNENLAADGYQIGVKSVRSGRRIYAATRTLRVPTSTTQARQVAGELESGHVMDQVTRMEASIMSDPALAIGSAKEFVETLCKAILSARGVVATGKEDLPKLVFQTRVSLALDVDSKTEETLRGVLAALGGITRGIAELRGQLGTGHGGSPSAPRPPVEVARLAVGMATSLGVFLWEMHNANPLASEPELGG